MIDNLLLFIAFGCHCHIMQSLCSRIIHNMHTHSHSQLTYSVVTDTVAIVIATVDRCLRRRLVIIGICATSTYCISTCFCNYSVSIEKSMPNRSRNSHFDVNRHRICFHTYAVVKLDELLFGARARVRVRQAHKWNDKHMAWWWSTTTMTTAAAAHTFRGGLI